MNTSRWKSIDSCGDSGNFNADALKTPGITLSEHSFVHQLLLDLESQTVANDNDFDLEAALEE